MKVTLFLFAVLAIQFAYTIPVPEVAETNGKQNDLSLDAVLKFIDDSSKALAEQLKNAATSENIEKLQTVFKDGVAKARAEIENLTKKNEP